MLRSTDYIKEVKKFTTSQYWNTGVRITAGVMLPTLLLEHFGLLAMGMPFLWGALFASITDAPGPIHHRRNGLLAAVGFNTLTVLITGSVRDYQIALVLVIIVFSFLYSMFGIFGNRASAIGTLATVIMVLNLVPHGSDNNIFLDTVLILSGGLWYTAFSLLLYRIRPYRLAEQAVGENLIAIADYLRARASLYREGENIENGFTHVMNAQGTVLKCQDQAREILFKTRQYVADASPRSRSTMMIFIDSIDLLERVMSSYQDYQQLHDALGDTGLMNKFYHAIYRVAKEVERIGLIVQSGAAVRDDVDLNILLHELSEAIKEQKVLAKEHESIRNLHALDKTLSSLRHITILLQRLVLYTRLEIKLPTSYSAIVEANRMAMGQPIEWEVVRENLTIKSNTFRHALRLSFGLLLGYVISVSLSLTQVYWVLLTIVTILKPVYSVSRQRNFQRLGGTLLGALLAAVAIYFVTDRAALLVMMIFSMIMSYSFLRINYFGFVLFLTIYIIITFHFLNPSEFTTLIEKRLIDTLIGSVIAAFCARFILPVWGREEIETSLREMLTAHRIYFDAALQALADKTKFTKSYKLARKNEVVALTNLSDNFQRILSEPKRIRQAEQLHQFVIASHILAGHIAALPEEKITNEFLLTSDAAKLVASIREEFQQTEHNFDHAEAAAEKVLLENQDVPHQLSVIYSLAQEMRLVVGKIDPFKVN
ncbi:MAG: hypothetical protein HOP08_04205 [Cyclobacteriaceae bacterium]|nr:hypothetical protein [Cyclobacteriaceae bacterium]